MTTIKKYNVEQYAYVVNDIQAACAKWTKMFGAGPFFLMDHIVIDSTEYRGEPMPIDVSYAFGQAGAAHIQLVQQHDDKPSVYRDVFKKGEQGFHHWAILVDDFDAAKSDFEKEGYEAVTTLIASGHVAYMDAREDLGGFVEVYERNPGVVGLFDTLRAEHEKWDGKTDPIRAFG